MISVLIIDDNHSFIDSLKVILKDIPMLSQVKSSSNFTRAQKEIEKNDFQLIIVENDTEVGMKGMDLILGYIKGDNSFSPDNFILLSSRPKEIAERAKQERIIFFRKPLNINDFKDYLQRLILEKFSTQEAK